MPNILIRKFVGSFWTPAMSLGTLLIAGFLTFGWPALAAELPSYGSTWIECNSDGDNGRKYQTFIVIDDQKKAVFEYHKDQLPGPSNLAWSTTVLEAPNYRVNRVDGTYWYYSPATKITLKGMCHKVDTFTGMFGVKEPNKF